MRLEPGRLRPRDALCDRPVRVWPWPMPMQRGAWLHLVDLDAARTGGYALAACCAHRSGSTACRCRPAAACAAMTTCGACSMPVRTRVVVGSLAVREPERVARGSSGIGGERITLALDTRQDADGRLAAAGAWLDRADSGRDPQELLQATRTAACATCCAPTSRVTAC
ncbi:MAG: HisA/HisF-related TIM barrel protein [Chiayiivirga sp.]|nr:HisA/HisF-related TIM barrel protein [Chiayiivirga sp.]